jgi:sporulation protein YlmC with PRC-barrel domain
MATRIRSVRYHTLVGQSVVDSDGARVGRVVDLIADAREERLVVVALRVGPDAFLQRIGAGWGSAAREIPWQYVAQLGEHVRLRVPASQLPAQRGR